MNITLIPSQLQGDIAAISSKSCAHRLLICAALAEGETRISCRDLNQDIEATVQCLTAMGAKIHREGEIFRIRPIQRNENAHLDCGESGSTLRFLLPVLCALGQEASITMHGRLPNRPLEPLWSELCAHGAVLKRPCPDLLTTSGQLRGNHFTIAADVSSQYISGLLFALPLLCGGTVTLTGKTESMGYITMTGDALRAFGVESRFEGNTIHVSPGPYRTPGNVPVEGDWSNAAFWLTADYLSRGKVHCTGLPETTSQGDSAVIDALEAIRLGNAEIDASQIPDLVPILAVAAALTPGETRITHAARLRLKESDRLETVTKLLNDLGGTVQQLEDGLIIRGQRTLRGGTADSCGDHRIAMSAAIASIGCESPVTILGAEATQKSYPGFFRDFTALGGQIAKEANP